MKLNYNEAYNNFYKINKQLITERADFFKRNNLNNQNEKSPLGEATFLAAYDYWPGESRALADSPLDCYRKTDRELDKIDAFVDAISSMVWGKYFESIVKWDIMENGINSFKFSETYNKGV